MAERRSEVSDGEDERYRFYPDLAYHYGWSWDELTSTPRDVLQLFLDAIGRLQAQHELILSRAAAYPHLTKTGRESRARALNRQAYGEEPDSTPESAKDPAAAAAIMGIPFVRVDADGKEVS